MTRTLLLLLFLSLNISLPPAQAASPASEQEIRLRTHTGTLHGTLQLSVADRPAPVVLFIAGSGPTDRDGNSRGLPGANNSQKLLAQALAARGIASLRYDKRGVGESQVAGATESDLRFESYVEDAASWIDLLRKDPRFSSVTVAGHSEGSLIGMLAAQRCKPDAFVSIAGVAQRASEVLRAQLRPRLPEELALQNEKILLRLEAGQEAGQVPAPLEVLYRPSVQPYMISWIRYKPAVEISKLSVPVLIIHGSTDIQVSTQEARALKRAHPAAQLRIVEGMNHVLKNVPADAANPLASYTDPTLPVAPRLVEFIAGFIRGVPH